MSDLTRTKAQVGTSFPKSAERYSFIAAATIEAGCALYLNSAGNADLADANGSGTDTFLGYALNGAAAGQPVDVLKEGHMTGFDLSGLAYFAPVYVSNTAGESATVAGSTSLITGRVVPLSNADRTKVLYVEALWR